MSFNVYVHIALMYNVTTVYLVTGLIPLMLFEFILVLS
jgi:hypothetical protein